MIAGWLAISGDSYVDLGLGRTLEIPAMRDRLVLRLPSRDEQVFELCEPFVGCEVAYWVNEGGQHTIVIGSNNRTIYHVATATQEMYVAAGLYRRIRDDYGLYHLKFVESDDRLLVVYEGGIVCLDPAVRCRWKVDHDYIDRHFVAVRDGVAWYESEFEGVWGYRMADGVRVEPGPGAPAAGATPG